MSKIIAFLPLIIVILPLSFLLVKLRHGLLSLIFLGLLGGCASNLNSFDKSPCVCDFEPINLTSIVEINHG